jgi:hypothetical protein
MTKNKKKHCGRELISHQTENTFEKCPERAKYYSEGFQPLVRNAGLNPSYKTDKQ